MRYLNTLIVSASLCVLPAISHAATPTSQHTPTAATASAPAVRSTPKQTAHAQATRVDEKSDDKARYAAREEGASEAQKYRGGDTVVIGATAATAILAVLLILILI
jgi:hypothetical protein